MSKKDELYGVRGWLALLVVGMCILGPLIAIGETSSNLHAAERESAHLANLPLWVNYKQAMWRLIALICGILIFGGWSLWKHYQSSSVYIAITCLWVANIIAVVGDYAITSSILGADIAASSTNEYVGMTIRALVAPTVWTLYLLNSKRVQNTYFEADNTLGNRFDQRVDPLFQREPPSETTGRNEDNTTSSIEKYDLLMKLKTLLDSGVINQAEYEEEKKKILS